MPADKRFQVKPTATSLALCLIALAVATALLFISIDRVQLITGDISTPPYKEAGRGLLSVGFMCLTLLAMGTVYWHRRLIEHGRRLVMPIVVGGGLLLMLTAMAFRPIASIDAYWYGLSARGWLLHGMNPYVESPLSLADDPLQPMIWPGGDHPTLYGPFASLAYAFPVLLTTDTGVQIFFTKLISVLGYLLAGLVLYRTLAKKESSWARLFTAFWLVNPLVALELANNGHNEGLLLLPLALVVAGLLEKDAGKILPGIVYGAFVKYWPLVLLPVLAGLSPQTLKRQWRKAIGLSALAFLTVIPFMTSAVNLPDLFNRLDIDNPHYFGPLLGFLASVLLLATDQSPWAIAAAKWIAFGLTLLTILAVTVLMVRRRLQPKTGALILVLCPLMVGPLIYPWYWLAILPFLAALRPRLAMAGFLGVAAVSLLGYSAAWAVILVTALAAWLCYRFVLRPFLNTAQPPTASP